MRPFIGISTWATLACLMIADHSSVIKSVDAFVPHSLQQQKYSSTSSENAVVLYSTSVSDLEGATNGAVGASKKSVASAPKIAQRWRKSTKQLATLGPASSDRVMIEKLFLAGADVFRLNFSHGSQEQKKELLDTIRSVEEQYSHPIAALGDLQGPKLRVSVSFAAMKSTPHLVLGGHGIRVTIVNSSWRSGFRRCTYKYDFQVHLVLLSFLAP